MSELASELITIDPIQQKYDEINEYFNGRLPNPVHEPIQFGYYLRVYDFYQRRTKMNEQSIENG